MRKFLLLVSLIVFSAVATVGAEDLTLPAAASIVGGAPFFSDVRAFNTSYTDSLDVEMRYRCFIGNPCTGTDPVNFTLAPRESRAFNDIVVSQFNAPDTAGGIEFDHSGSGEQLVVTSRLYSTAPVPTVGMFIPGLENSEAHATTVLTSIRNGATSNGSFRTNVGVYNREDSAVDVTFRIIDGGAQVGNPVTRNVAAHSGAQVSGIFGAAGQGGHVTENAVIVVSATHEVFSYAAVIDNNTTDPIFVIGAEDQPFQATTPGGPTVTQPGATNTPTQPPTTNTPTRTPTATPTQPGAQTVVVQVGQGGNRYVPNNVTINVGDTVRWEWAGSGHSVTEGPCPPCSVNGADFDSGVRFAGFVFERTFNTAGTVQYFCQPHTVEMTGTINVNP